MTNNFGDDLKKIMLAGVGAIAAATEKSKELIDEFSKKGEDTASKSKEIIDDFAKKGESALEQGKVLNEELKAKFQRTFEKFKDEAQKLDMDDMADSLMGMTDDALLKIRNKLDQIIEDRASRPEDSEACCEGDCCEDECCEDECCEDECCEDECCDCGEKKE